MNLEGWRKQLRAVRRSEDINMVFAEESPRFLVKLGYVQVEGGRWMGSKAGRVGGRERYV